MRSEDMIGDARKSVTDMTPDEAKAELAKHELEKMTRRAALAKVGLRTGMAIFAAFSIDDLARKAAAVMALRSHDNVIVEKVARDLHGAGVAFADNEGCYDTVVTMDEDGNLVETQVPCSHPPGSNGPANCVGGTVGTYCTADIYKQNCEQCCDGVYRNQCSAYDDSPFHVQKNACKSKCANLPSNPNPPPGYP